MKAPNSSDPKDHLPRLTNKMVARIQGFPAEWEFAGKKTRIDLQTNRKRISSSSCQAIWNGNY